MATSKFLSKSKRDAIRRKRRIASALAISAIAIGVWLWFALFQPPPLPEPTEEEEEAVFFMQAIEYPDWFSPSYLNLSQDLQKALQQDKLGIALYFSREDCVCCDVMKEVNLENPNTAAYIQRYFNVIAIDVWGTMPVTDFDGIVYNEARFAKLRHADATPSMIFYNSQGQEIFRLRGYHEPYIFQAVLDYVIGHQPNEDFNQYSSYLFRPDLFDYFELHANKLFLSPPYHLDRSKIKGERPLAVFFERGNCPGCDFLHSQLLNRIDIVGYLHNMDIIQLDIHHPTPLVLPDGSRSNTLHWVSALDITYTPTIIFFNSQGDIIQRTDSISMLRDLHNILPVVLQKSHIAGVPAENHVIH
jgi:thioredoxin-related protein